MTIARRVPFARALGSRPFALLWLGQTVSALGDGAFFTALPWTVLLLTHSGTAMGLVGIAELLPRVAFVLVGGVVADRLPRRLILLCSDAGRAIAVLAVAALAAMHALQFWHLVALGLLFGFADGFFTPAYASIPPQLVPPDDLPSANALTSLGRQMSLLVGPALGAGFITFLGVQGAFAFDGLSFIVSALCLAAIRVPPAAHAVQIADAGEGEIPGRHGIRGVIADIREGLNYVTRSTWLWATITIFSIFNMGWAGALLIAAPKLIHDHFHSGVWLLGALQASLSVGSILATLVVGSIHHLRHRGIVAYVGVACSSVALLALGLPFPVAAAPVLVCTASAVIGAGLGIFEPIWTTTLQQLVPADKLGRVSGIDWLGSLVVAPIGMALGGVLTDRIGPASVFVGAGAINVALTLSGLAIRGIRELD